MTNDKISGIWRNNVLPSVISVGNAEKKHKKQDNDKEKTFQESLEDTVEISDVENNAKIADEQYDDNNSTDSGRQTDNLPGGVINIIVK